MVRMVQGVCLTFLIAGCLDGRSAFAGSNQSNVPRVAIVNIDGGWPQMGDTSLENLTRLRNAGVNTIALWGTSMTRLDPRTSKIEWWKDPATQRGIVEIGQRCKSLKLDLYFVPYFGTTINHYPQVKIIPSKDMKGEGEKSPSWFDLNYRAITTARDAALARYVKMGLAKGVLMEPEVYGDGALMERGQLDFGDAAYGRFAKALGIRGPMPKPADRAKELLASGLIGNFVEWQMQDLKQFSRQRAEALRAVAPNIQLGFYQPGPWTSWVLRSLAQGMYEKGRPLLILDASTYPAIGKSWTLNWEEPDLKRHNVYRANVLRDWGVQAHLVNGIYPYPKAKGYVNNPLWKRCQNPRDIVTFFRDSVEAGNGWWIWNETGDPKILLKHIQESR